MNVPRKLRLIRAQIVADRVNINDPLGRSRIHFKEFNSSIDEFCVKNGSEIWLITTMMMVVVFTLLSSVVTSIFLSTLTTLTSAVVTCSLFTIFVPSVLLASVFSVTIFRRILVSGTVVVISSFPIIDLESSSCRSKRRRREGDKRGKSKIKFHHLGRGQVLKDRSFFWEYLDFVRFLWCKKGSELLGHDTGAHTFCEISVLATSNL
mmetsp:Transcript_25357/g.41648  ORF Transcript_25357/g.41648 Transcript_25357/m.41648 type:complete len:207 (+) Transcript_25357:102-722(+)